MIDNYDSFTFNIVRYFAELGADVTTYRNDEIELDDIHKMRPSKIVISPGPKTPEQAGNSLKIIKQFSGQIPILGVCLGHQAIAHAFGGKIIRANSIKHGKTTKVHHHQSEIFHKVPTPFQATLYNSLVVDDASLPAGFEITAWTENEDGSMDEIMGIKHKSLPLAGIQFHPESVLTEFGHQLLQNFLEQYE